MGRAEQGGGLLRDALPTWEWIVWNVCARLSYGQLCGQLRRGGAMPPCAMSKRCRSDAETSVPRTLRHDPDAMRPDPKNYAAASFSFFSARALMRTEAGLASNQRS